MGQLPVRHPAGKDLLQSGDSGYGPHFKAIGEQFGPIDLAIMENGQYDQDWKYIHMMPEETAQAADDLRARSVLPGHAGRFVLAKHSWDDPYQRLAAASEGREWRLVTPMLGEPVGSLIRHNHLTPGGANRQSGSEGEKRYEYIRSGD